MGGGSSDWMLLFREKEGGGCLQSSELSVKTVRNNINELAGRFSLNERGRYQDQQLQSQQESSLWTPTEDSPLQVEEPGQLTVCGLKTKRSRITCHVSLVLLVFRSVSSLQLRCLSGGFWLWTESSALHRPDFVLEG